MERICVGACVLDAPSVEIFHSFKKGGIYSLCIPYVFPMYSLYTPYLLYCLCIIVEIEVEEEEEVEEL